MAETKELTRQEQIEDLQAEYDRRKANEQELGKQLNELLKSLQVMDKMKTQEIEKTLDSLPDASPKGIVDKILQLPDEKRGQLLGNIKKLEIAVANEQRKAAQAHHLIKRIQNEIEQEEINNRVVEVFDAYLDVLADYKACRQKFYGKLYPMVQETYLLDPYFPRRADALGLNKSVAVALESHMKEGSNESMEYVIERAGSLGDAYGPVLIEKGYMGGAPDDGSSYFGITESDLPPLKDPENY